MKQNEPLDGIDLPIKLFQKNNPGKPLLCFLYFSTSCMFLREEERGQIAGRKDVYPPWVLIYLNSVSITLDKFQAICDCKFCRLPTAINGTCVKGADVNKTAHAVLAASYPKCSWMHLLLINFFYCYLHHSFEEAPEACCFAQLFIMIYKLGAWAKWNN